MLHSAWLALAILGLTVALFLYGRWRHDVVAVAALLACTAVGLVPGQEAFIGFSHPAVVTVVGVLILSDTLERTGLVDVIAEHALPKTRSHVLAILSVSALGAFFSAFMNNVGALALLMPIALQTAQRLKMPPGHMLMPLAFSTILGGLTTLIGTPSNLIVSSFRAQAEAGQSGFSMFAFTPVGGTVAVLGVLFISWLGPKLIPKRLQTGASGLGTTTYLTETRVLPDTKAVGMRIAELEEQLLESDAQIVGFLRQQLRINVPHRTLRLRPHDVLLLEADPKKLTKVLSTLGLVFNEDKPKVSNKSTTDNQAAQRAQDGPEIAADNVAQSVGSNLTSAPQTTARFAAQTEAVSSTALPPAALAADELDGASAQVDEQTTDQDLEAEESKKETVEDSRTELVELVVLPGSMLIARSAADVRLRSRYQINLLAISRQGKRLRARPRATLLRTGDVLLMQGAPENILEFAQSSGCASLATRELRVPNRRNMVIASVVMLFAVLSAALGWWSAALSFTLGILLLLLFNVIAPRNLYQAVDWSVVVLLAALIPVAQAIEHTGAASLIAEFVLHQLAQGHATWALLLMMITTMMLSDLMNNAATAAIMSPIAIETAQQLNVNSDTFLMAVAIGASCAFLTPIGHQNNTLILGPGGFRFSDYWRLGLPLDVLIVGVSIPLLLYVWPL